MIMGAADEAPFSYYEYPVLKIVVADSFRLG